MRLYRAILRILTQSRLTLVCLVLAACTAGQAAPGLPRITGALDVLPLLTGVQEELTRQTGLEFEITPSANGVQQVLDGEAEAVILGREPTPAEREALASFPVAYDAVCLLINTRTYEPGTQINSSGSVIEYQARTEGLKELIWQDVQGYFATVYRRSAEPWLWNGDYEAFIYAKDNFGRPIEDRNNPGYSAGVWRRTPVYVYGEATQAGKFDTQGHLFQVLGWDETVLETPDIGFIPSIFESEEEVISFRFYLTPPNPNPENTSPFNFYLLPASRQVTERALEQGFALRPIRIDGADCLANPADIYAGKYPLSRKVYLLAPRPLSPQITRLKDFLLSPDGQERIRQLSFLPLPPGERPIPYAP